MDACTLPGAYALFPACLCAPIFASKRRSHFLHLFFFYDNDSDYADDIRTMRSNCYCLIACICLSVCLSVGHSVLLSLSVYLSLLSVHMCIRAHGVCRRRPSYSHAHLFIHDLLASYGVAEHRAEQWSFKYGGGLGRDTPVGSYITILPQNLIRIHKLSNTLCMYCKRSMCLFICGSLQASSNT